MSGTRRPAPPPVRLRDDAPASADQALLDGLAEDASDAARATGGAVEAALGLAGAWGARLPRPGSGRTTVLWEALATVGAVDLQVARTLEPQVDALAILDELPGDPWPVPPGSTWGVYAAEGPGVRLAAAPAGDAWRLDGVKPWCSLADRVTHALLTAWVGEERRLFAVALDQPGITPAEQAWVARGLREVRSTAVEFDGATARPVGEPGWYLRREGFAWGGIGVAAVWYGGAVGIARRLQAQGGRRPLDQVGRAHLGSVDTALYAARAVLAEAALLVDGGEVLGDAASLLAARVRAVVAGAVAEVLGHADRAMGPAPLALEPEHAARVADLHLYVRQHHAERDSAVLGSMLDPGAGTDQPTVPDPGAIATSRQGG